VFSLGSNGVTGFESDIRSRYPHCAIHVYDPTISEETAAVVAARTEVRGGHVAMVRRIKFCHEDASLGFIFSANGMSDRQTGLGCSRRG